MCRPQAQAKNVEISANLLGNPRLQAQGIPIVEVHRRVETLLFCEIQGPRHRPRPPLLHLRETMNKIIALGPLITRVSIRVATVVGNLRLTFIANTISFQVRHIGADIQTIQMMATTTVGILGTLRRGVGQGRQEARVLVRLDSVTEVGVEDLHQGIHKAPWDFMTMKTMMAMTMNRTGALQVRRDPKVGVAKVEVEGQQVEVQAVMK